LILRIYIFGMVEMMIEVIMKLMCSDLVVSESNIGQLVNLYAITFAVAGPILVKLTNRFSRRMVLLWSLLTFVVGNIIIAIAPNFSILVIGRILSSAVFAFIVVNIFVLSAFLIALRHCLII